MSIHIDFSLNIMVLCWILKSNYDGQSVLNCWENTQPNDLERVYFFLKLSKCHIETISLSDSMLRKMSHERNKYDLCVSMRIFNKYTLSDSFTCIIFHLKHSNIYFILYNFYINIDIFFVLCSFFSLPFYFFIFRSRKL